MESEQQNLPAGPKKTNKPLWTAGGIAGLVIVVLIGLVVFMGLKNKSLQDEVASLAGGAAGQDGGYLRHDMDYGIAVELPADWRVSSKEANLQKEKAGADLARDSLSMDISYLNQNTVFSANSADSSATVQIVVFDSQMVAESFLMIRGMTEQPGGPQNVNQFFRPTLEQTLAAVGTPLVELRPTEAIELNGEKVLLMSYQCKQAGTGALIEARQYHFCFPKYVVQMTVCWEAARIGEFEPVLDRLLESAELAGN